MMRVLIIISTLLTVVTAFAPTQHSVIVPRSPIVVETNQAIAHRNRRSTIVQDGKANGMFFYVDLYTTLPLEKKFNLFYDTHVMVTYI